MTVVVYRTNRHAGGPHIYADHMAKTMMVAGDCGGMVSGTDDSLLESPAARLLGEVLSVRNLVLVITGMLAGYSVAVLGTDTVAVPLVGSLPGTAVGVVGLVVALTVYRQWGGCGCGNAECGCSGECGDSCSYDR